MKAVGIGCFWFASKKFNSENYKSFSIPHHLEHIRQALNSVDNVSNVKIDDIRTLSFPPDTFEYADQNFFPIFSEGGISFDIFVPSRIQEKHAFQLSIGHGIENFHVDIRFGYDLPVAYISFDVPHNLENWQDLSPAFAVAFIREHLKQKLSNHEALSFECLGPSPLHAEIFVRTKEGGSSEIVSTDFTVLGQGYRRILTEVPESDDVGVIEQFSGHYNETLSAYYSVVVYRNDLLHLRGTATNLTRSLFEEKRSGLFKNIGMGKVIDRVFKSVLDERLCRIDLSEHLRNRKEAINEKNIFYSLVMEEVEDVSQIPADDIKEILRMLEERRQQYFGNFATLASGLAGGLIGAVIGAALTIASSGP